MSYLDTDFDAGESSPSEDSEDDSEDLSDAEVTPTVKKNLKALISDSLVISNFDDRSPKYCPRGVLESLLTRDAIQEALFPMQEDQFLHDGELSTADKKFLDLIEESAKRVFAIALLSSQIDCDRMREALRILIVKNHFTDKDVPIKNPIRANAANPKAKPKWPKAFMEWELEEQSISTRFYDTQWSFLSPTFVKGVNKDVPLHSKHILPFQRQMTISTPGAFSRVYQVLIHPNHFLDQGNKITKAQVVAVKEIRLADEIGDANMTEEQRQKREQQVFDAEKGALVALNKLRSKHIIECVSTFARGKTRYLILEWADGGNLRDFWKEKVPVLSAENVEQLVNQLAGIAGALNHVHNYMDDSNWRHGDLKPENILRFDDGSWLGTLKIADLGLAKRHDAATVNRFKRTSTPYGTARYEAPEVTTDPDGPRSRAYDIWSMGCVIIEFVVWLLYGPKELDNFNTAIKSNQQQGSPFFLSRDGNQTAELHPAVVAWIQHLRKNDPECRPDANSAVASLLDIVENDLLVVALEANVPKDQAPGTAHDVAAEYAEEEDSEAPSIDPRRTSNAKALTIPIIEISKAPDIIPLTRRVTTTGGKYRASAEIFYNSVEYIKERKEAGKCTFFTKRTRTNLSLPSSAVIVPDSLRPVGSTARKNVRGAAKSVPTPALAPDQTQFPDYKQPPLSNDDWTFQVDNKFVQDMLADIDNSAVSLRMAPPAKLCGRCSKLGFASKTFTFKDTIQGLANSAVRCELCTMLLKRQSPREVLKASQQTSEIEFERLESVLGVKAQYPPILSLCSNSELQRPHIQIGFTNLPMVGGDTFFKIVKAWLRDCDENHREPDGRSCGPPVLAKLPTRLIDVGQTGDSGVHLYATTAGELGKYVALSHRWGDQREHPPLRTLRTNIRQFFEDGIDLTSLPKTFKDAVLATRALGIRYLWIDSLCIIQGPDGDFTTEATKMEDVFSSAYCVLAATRATGQWSGFLGDRSSARHSLQYKYAGFKEPFAICEFVDDFKKDVLEGKLNTRGWVLQERVLARRTIYFAETQTYWECRRGVRCETMTKMYNELTAFYGDPDFPQKVKDSNQGGKIAAYQNLYSQYSRLDFSNWEDRPVGIAGLETRLIRDFNIRGGLGLLDDSGSSATSNSSLLCRSLLWMRATGVTTAATVEWEAIKFKDHVRVPSWSWMAYRGAIDYLRIEGASAEWTCREVNSPWYRGPLPGAASPAPGEASARGALGLPADGGVVGRWHTADRTASSIELQAVARTFDLGRSRGGSHALYLDDRTAAVTAGSCVIVARARQGLMGPSGDDQNSGKMHYVLLVTPVNAASLHASNKIYKRTGIGLLPGHCISLGGGGTLIKIQ